MCIGIVITFPVFMILNGWKKGLFEYIDLTTIL
jgi:hypothetical protein